jgi:hypothetical protein
MKMEYFEELDIHPSQKDNYIKKFWTMKKYQ